MLFFTSVAKDLQFIIDIINSNRVTRPKINDNLLPFCHKNLTNT